MLQLTVSVEVTESEVTPTVGHSYSLTCNVPRANVNSYQWLKQMNDIQSRASVLSFSPLSLSDAGLYTCIVTVNGRMYSGNATILLKSEC